MSTPSVLVVDDDVPLAEGFQYWLNDKYNVTVVNSGTDALNTISDEFDVVLLDREMPDMNGEDVLEHIRDDGYDCRVAMVTGMEVDYDIVAMGFDDYLVKPVTKDDLHDTVAELLELHSEDETIRQAHKTEVKKEALEDKKPKTELENDERYEQLNERLQDLQNELDGVVAGDSDANESR